MEIKRQGLNRFLKSLHVDLKDNCLHADWMFAAMHDIDSNNIYVRVMTKRAEERTWKFDEYSAVDDRILIEPINFELSVFDFV